MKPLFGSRFWGRECHTRIRCSTFDITFSDLQPLRLFSVRDVSSCLQLLAAAGGPKALGDRAALEAALKEYESRQIPRTKTLQR